MKVYRIIERVVLILSFVFFGVACLLGAITLEMADVEISKQVLTIAMSGFAFVGFFLFNSKNEVAKKVGFGLTTGGMVYLASVSISSLEVSTVSVVGLVGIILFVIYLMLKLIEKIISKDVDVVYPEQDKKIQAVLAWKKLLEEGIISKEEFEKKRVEILKLK